MTSSAPDEAGSMPGSALRPVLPWAMAALAAAWVLAGTRPAHSYGDTLFSRLATVYALAHHGTFSIGPHQSGEPNPFARDTVDKVQFGGRLLSSKPPVLPLLMTGEYLLMNRVAGWRLDDRTMLPRITWVMTVSLVGAPFILMAWAFTRAVQYSMPGAFGTAFLGVAAVAGTQAGGYAIIFNNHVPAASAVVVCFLLCVRMLTRRERAKKWELLAFGVAAGFSATIDVPTAVFPALFGLALARRRLRDLLVFSAPPALILVAIQSAALYVATGSPLPVQLHPEAYLFENSYWRNPRGVDALNYPRAIYLFHILVGRVGIFSLFPVTLLAIPGLLTIRRAPDGYVAAGLCAAVGAGVLCAYYALTTNNFGGVAYGFRWFIAPGPVLLLLAPPFVARLRSPWHWIVPIILLGVSFYSVWGCILHPWDVNTEWTVRVFGPSL